MNKNNTADTVKIDNKLYYSTLISVPDVRIIFKGGALYFDNMKEVSDKNLFDVYLGLEDYLRTLPSIVKDKNGDILGMKS